MELIKENNISSIYKYTNNDIEYIIKKYHNYNRHMFIELNILLTTNHPNIIHLIDIHDNDIRKFKLPMEKYTLLSLLENNIIIKYDKIDILLQIAIAINYIHYNNILHLDLKLDNIMITNGIIKLIDFGSAEYIFNKKIKTKEKKCTATHRPPENFRFTKNDYYIIDYSFDIWSFGIIMVEILTNVPMYMNQYFPKLYKNMDNDTYENNVYNFICSEQFNNIRNILPKKLRSCLYYEKIKRLKINEIINILFEIEKNLNISNNIVSLKTLKIYHDLHKRDHLNNDSYWCKYYIYLLKKYPEKIKNFPKEIIMATCNLINQLEYNIGIANITKEYIDQIILLSNMFLQFDLNDLFKNCIKQKLNIDIIKKIMMDNNNIIIISNIKDSSIIYSSPITYHEVT